MALIRKSASLQDRPKVVLQARTKVPTQNRPLPAPGTAGPGAPRAPMPDRFERARVVPASLFEHT